MSSFIVSADCINCIATYLHEHADSFRSLTKSLGYDVSRNQDLANFALDLHRLNCTAMEQRYRKPFVTEEFRFRLVTRGPVVVYKAASCLEYQCSEGDVPERPLFKLLQLVIDQIARQIVQTSSEYDKAPWGG